MAREHPGKMDLKALLISPVQRFPHYEMLLKVNFCSQNILLLSFIFLKRNFSLLGLIFRKFIIIHTFIFFFIFHNFHYLFSIFSLNTYARGGKI